MYCLVIYPEFPTDLKITLNHSKVFMLKWVSESMFLRNKNDSLQIKGKSYYGKVFIKSYILYYPNGRFIMHGTVAKTVRDHLARKSL